MIILIDSKDFLKSLSINAPLKAYSGKAYIANFKILPIGTFMSFLESNKKSSACKTLRIEGDLVLFEKIRRAS